MIREVFADERTADAAPLIRTRERRAALAIVAVFATIVSASAFAGLHSGPFQQRWNLFAPAPPSATLDLYLIVRYDDGHVGIPRDLSGAVRREQTAHRFDAPRLVRVVTKLGQ